jgi:hypothetical protein
MWQGAGCAQLCCRCGSRRCFAGVSPTPVQMWQGCAQFWSRCGRGGPTGSPGADVVAAGAAHARRCWGRSGCRGLQLGADPPTDLPHNNRGNGTDNRNKGTDNRDKGTDNRNKGTEPDRPAACAGASPCRAQPGAVWAGLCRWRALVRATAEVRRGLPRTPLDAAAALDRTAARRCLPRDCRGKDTTERGTLLPRECRGQLLCGEVATPGARCEIISVQPNATRRDAARTGADGLLGCMRVRIIAVRAAITTTKGGHARATLARAFPLRRARPRAESHLA